MFRTDSSLKGVARRENNRGGGGNNVIRNNSNQTRPDNARDNVVERANAEREEREWKRKVRVYVVRIQSRWRQHRIESNHFTTELHSLSSKLDDVEKISTAFAAVGMPFIPPAETAHALLLPFTLLWTRSFKQKRIESYHIIMKRFIHLILLPSVKSNDPKQNFLSTIALKTSDDINSSSPKVPVHLLLRIRRLIFSCIDTVSDEYTKLCKTQIPLSDNEMQLVNGCLSLIEEICSLATTCSDKGSQEESNSSSLSSIAPQVEVSVVQTLRVKLILMCGLRNLFNLLPEPKNNLSDSSQSVRLGGCPLPISVHESVKNVLSRLWALSLFVLQPPPGHIPRPTALVMESFAENILSIPLLFWREEGRDLGRLGVADKLPGSAVDALIHPHLFFPLIKAMELLDMRMLETINETRGDIWMLGNIIALGRRSCLIYGTAVSDAGYSWQNPRDSSLWCDFVSSLLETAPLGLLSDTAPVTWHSEGSVHTPVMLSKPLLIQVRSLLEGRSSTFLDFLACTQLNGLEDIMTKYEAATPEDEKEEQALTAPSGGMMTPSSAAQIESRRRKSSGWLDSTWAHRIAIKAQKGAQMIGESFLNLTSSSSLSSSESISGGESGGGGGGGRLLNTSHTSLAAAKGDFGGRGGVASALAASSYLEDMDDRAAALPEVTAPVKKKEKGGEINPAAVRSYARLLTVLLRRWLHPAPGNGSVSSTPLVFWMLNTLALSSVVAGRPRLVRLLWTYLQHQKETNTQFSLFGKKDGGGGGGGSGGAATLDVAVVSLICALLSQLLVVLDDTELYEGDNSQREQAISLRQLRRIIKYLKPMLFQRIWDQDSHKKVEELESYFMVVSSRALRDLYDRSSRRPFIAQQAWLVAAAESGRALAEVQGATPRGSRLLSSMPYALLFVERLKLFKQLIDTDKANTQRSGSPGVRVRIRRTRVLEDGLRELNGLGAAMKKKLMVEFINAQGVSESGLDAGGLFKEFWTDLSALAFNMDFGLFRTTATDGTLYPNPAAESLQGPEYLELFAFLGRILGKALYEGLTVEPKFAHFFLAYMRGNYNYLNTWHDLQTLDAELYKNLMFLKTYKGDAADLCLTFTVAEDSSFGDNRETELVSGGSKLEVTNRNKLEYVERVANHLLVRRLRPASEAFRRGLAEIIDPQWLTMFNEPELQVLISGAETAIDVDDLKNNCRYQGYMSSDRVITRFWKVVASLTAAEQALLLRFVTSCQRPPPLGFEQLEPKFCVQRIDDTDKLPSASTCFNTLKLPTYSSEKIMKQKLLMSISSNSGFELT